MPVLLLAARRRRPAAPAAAPWSGLPAAAGLGRVGALTPNGPTGVPAPRAVTAGGALPAALLLLLEDQPPLAAAAAAGDFFTAFVAWFLSDPGAQQAFPGGVFDHSAPTRPAYPYVRTSPVNPLAPETADDDVMDLTLSCYATGTAGAAVDCGKVLLARLADPARPPVAYGNWEEYGFEPDGQAVWSQVGKTASAAGAEDVFRYDIPVRFRVVRVDPAVQEWPSS